MPDEINIIACMGTVLLSFGALKAVKTFGDNLVDSMLARQYKCHQNDKRL